MHQGQHRRLDSWKEIADYLGRNVRTLLRWEKEKGLPVHRMPGGKRSGVFAHTDEIDAWMLNGSDSTTPYKSELTAAVKTASNACAAGGNKRYLPARSWIIGVVVVVSVLGLVLSATLVWNHAGPPVRIAFTEKNISALDEKGRLCWTRGVAQIVPEKLPSGMEARLSQPEIDRDRNRVFFVVDVLSEKSARVHSSDLYCLDARGGFLWRYRPHQLVSGGGRQYQGPWNISKLLIPPDPESQNVWITIHHHTGWPSFLLRLDLNGQAAVHFINAGWLFSQLCYFRNSSGSYVLVAGINNEYDESILAVVRADAPPSASPRSPGSRYVLDDSPKSGPHRYFVFPRSELNLATDAPCNVVATIRVLADHIEIRTREARTEIEPVDVIGIYELSPDFDLIRILRSDTYWDAHRRLENEGKLKHAARECPERTMPSSVRVWAAETGWTFVPARPAGEQKLQTGLRTKGVAVQ